MSSINSYDNRAMRLALCPFFAKKCAQRKQTNTYGIVFSRRNLGRVGSQSDLPCPFNGPTATR